MAEWKAKHYPDGCISCGTVDKPHAGYGLCAACKYKRKKADGVEDSATGDTDDVDVHAPDDPADTGSDLGASETSETAPRVEPAGKVSERRPGAASSSSVHADQADAPDAPDPTRGRLRGLFGRKARAEPERPAPRSTRETRPAKVRGGRRVSTADTVEDIIGALGGLTMQSPKHRPLGVYLQFSAGVSAEIVDDAVNGTIVDKMVLQPICKGRGRFDALGAVFGPPAIILAIENNPARAELLLPLLKSSIRNSLPMMVKAAKKVQAKEAAINAAAAEMFGDIPDGEDPVDALIAMIFGGWTPPTADETDVDDEPIPFDETDSIKVA